MDDDALFGVPKIEAQWAVPDEPIPIRRRRIVYGARANRERVLIGVGHIAISTPPTDHLIHFSTNHHIHSVHHKVTQDSYDLLQ